RAKREHYQCWRLWDFGSCGPWPKYLQSRFSIWCRGFRQTRFFARPIRQKDKHRLHPSPRVVRRDRDEGKMISVIVPIRNEAESLATLQTEIGEVARRVNLDLEVYYIDDGSTDKSWSVICDLARREHWVHGIRLRRNFGKAAALSAGFQASHG